MLQTHRDLNTITGVKNLKIFNSKGLLGPSQMNLTSFLLFASRNIMFLLCVVLGFNQITIAAQHGNETDKLSLLAFKSNITNDPFGVLSSWNESVHFCQWRGVICGHRHQRVIMLDLGSQKLTGSISPYIGNLSFLRRLHLQNNSFSHVIPRELGFLQRLEYLWLYNNSISGTIPDNISTCSNLIGFDVSYNQLVGKIPMELGSLLKLEVVSISFNNLTGTIPPSLGNLSSLVKLNLAYNDLVGSIPTTLGQVSKLEYFALPVNRLSGTIPSSIFNLSSLTTFTVTVNQIQGTLPADLGTTLPNLEFFAITTNQFTGSIPVSMSNMSNLAYLQAMENNLTGSVPHFEKLHKLRWFTISRNQLGGLESNDLSFISSLTNATDLEILALDNNNFGGVLPESFANLSINLVGLWLGNNQIYGSILNGIANFINLTRIQISGNRFSGNIPPDIEKLQDLGVLQLSRNRFSGIVPSSLGNLNQLTLIYLSDNNFHGNIPSSLGQCTNLLVLDLSQNNLSGTIPLQIFGLSSLSYIYFSQNQITGSFPAEVGKLKSLELLDVSENLFSGEIPSTLGSCVGLEGLNMQGNFFRGTIPSSFSTLSGMQSLDLSYNNLSGQIPEYLEGFDLQYLNLSFNDLEGPVPNEGIFKNASEFSVNGNPKLCGGLSILQLPRCNFKQSKKNGLSFKLKLIISIVFGFLGLSLVLGFVYFLVFRKSKQVPYADSSSSRLDFKTLLRATNGFSSSNLIGVGSYGSVYKGILDHDETFVAVKVFNLLHHGASKSFMAECEALKNIRHRNLVKVLSVCSGVDYHGKDFKALVFEFMMNGSLDEWLHDNSSESLSNVEPKKLSLLQRLNISIDVTCALDYLHNDCQAPIVHCDIKPSNVLLDNELVGHLGDFGLAKFLSIASQNLTTNQSSSAGIRGTIGYTAPEYGMRSEVSTCGDVYSFGILLLEMFTGKRPTNDMFKDDFDLQNFAKAALPDGVSEVVDPILLQEIEEEETSRRNTKEHGFIRSHKTQNCLISVLRVGVACSSKLTAERPNIAVAAAELQSIRNVLLGTGINRERRAMK
ncbi:unnamed protein product [Ilex paraguariensis]|uniref:non-specific serine/threonine protein kinase n=1 Tax=Ilex paraguariensis TaxID=185542 RepID=A0ABC8QU50_9AQUA